MLLLHCPTSAVTTKLAGQVIAGASVSLTVTVKMQLELFPLSSVASHVTVLVPTEKVEPLGGLHTTVTMVQLSLALAV